MCLEAISISSHAFPVFHLGPVLYILKGSIIFFFRYEQIFPSLEKDIEMIYGIYNYVVIIYQYLSIGLPFHFHIYKGFFPPPN